jgi:eukaryotic-like serine/threonine-protein kinase
VAINSNTTGTTGEDDPVAALVAAGRYGEAAAAARAAGQPERAAALYERIWEFGQAAACAREAGDLGRALRNALDAGDEPQAAELTALLDGAGDEGRRAALEALVGRRRFARAGELAEALGLTDQAIDYYRRGGRDLDAGRLLEGIGRDREAARLYERVLDLGIDGPDEARARLRLGLLLARRMKHDDAARHLQQAADHESTRHEARRALVVELAALGLRDAARDALLAARADEPELPVDLDRFLREHRGEVVAPDGGDDDAEIIAGRYRLEKLLGAGGAGRVFRARDEVSGRAVALKMYTRTQARGDQAYERFVREARIASSLRHPNLVEVYEVSADQGFMVMEIMVGGSLADRLAGEPMTIPAIRRVVLDVLAGLELAHQRGVIHRDLKPANIFFDARGTAKLGDFGVAHLLDMGATQTGGLIGTLAYMSPEQITGAPLTIAADLYALGVTLFEALTGRLPFLGPDFVAQHLGDEPPAPSAVAENLAPAWDPIVARLLAKNPDDRYDAIETLRRDLSAIDLGSAAEPKPLVLPRASAAPAAASSSTSIPVQNGDTEEAAPRYQFETTIGQSSNSRLARALDSWLNRSVIIERFEPGSVDEAVAARLQTLARGGGPFVQRALAFDRTTGVAVFEAPSGTPFAEAFAAEPPGPRDAARLLKRLARAVAPLHEVGAAHGVITEKTVLVDTACIPTILASGLGAITAEPTAAGDIDAIVRLLARAISAPPSTEGLLDTLAPDLRPQERAAILALDAPRTGEDLYTFADAVEIALLKADRRQRK